MTTYSIYLLGHELPLYGLCLYAGIGIAVFMALLLVRKSVLPFWDFVGAGCYAMIGAMIGSKLLFLIVSIREIITLHLPLYAIIKGGFVFYGGLIGGAFGFYIYAKQYKMQLLEFTDISASCLPLGHAFGRIGCFFGGCCYGKKYVGSLSVIYHSAANLNTPLETPLFPVQLFAAGALFLLGVILCKVYLNKWEKRGYTTSFYLILYSIGRFMVEFFRGDRERGIYLGFSTAQWISLLLFVAGVVLWKKIQKINVTE